MHPPWLTGYHVLTFDYHGFGPSGGERPTNLRSVDEAMPYWREHWMPDVQTAYETLIAQDGVQSTAMGIAGASCGVFIGLFLIAGIAAYVSVVVARAEPQPPSVIAIQWAVE